MNARGGRGSPYRRGRFDVGAWRERVKHRLTTRFAMRLHMTLVMGLVFAAAFVTERSLLALHVESMALRYFVASITGYAAFFGLVRAWLWYVTEDAMAELAPEHEPDEVALAIDPEAPPRSGDAPRPLVGATSSSRRSSGGNIDLPSVNLGGGSSGGGGSFDADGDGCVAILIIGIVVVVAAALFGAAGYVIYQAPALLGEAAFELLLASVLARSSRRVTRDGWSGSVLSATWKPALALAVVATLGGFAAQRLCPGETTMRGVIKQCVVATKKR